MARQALTAVPVDIISTLSLTAGTNYVIQAEIPGAGGSSGGYQSQSGPFVHLDDGATAPVAANRSNAGLKIRHLEIIIASGTNLWVWTTKGPAAINVYASAL